MLLILLAALPGFAAARGMPRLDKEEVAKQLEAAGDDPIRLLELAAQSEEEVARRLRQKAGRLLQEMLRRLDAAALRKVGQRLARVLTATTDSPATIVEVLGEPKRIGRQILFRRYLEQWTYEYTLPLIITIEYEQGRVPRIRSVHISEAK